MRNYLITLALILLCGAVFGMKTELSIDVNQWQKKTADYPLLLTPGQPLLPYYPVMILLPFGEDYRSANVELSSEKRDFEGVNFDFAKKQQPISMPDQFVLTEKDENVYGKNEYFPQKDWEYLGTQYYRGYAIAVFNVYPFKYNPVSQKLRVNMSFSIEVATSFNTQTADDQARFVTHSVETLDLLTSLCAEHSAISTYTLADSYRIPGNSRFVDPNSPKRMIIITDNQRADWFGEYVLWKESNGISTGVFTTDQIYANYVGVDNAEKVRNFIIDAYSSWSTSLVPLEYVILGGDDEVVPERGVYGQVWDTIDHKMTSDLYFSNLDGNWNANNNQIYGEAADGVDFIPEVHIGRFPAETQAEFSNIFRKTRYYVDNSTFSNNTAIFFGENLNNNPLTWGGDYKDEVAIHLPSSFTYSTQYQRDGTYNYSSVWNSINSGVNVMNHMGHSNENILMSQSLGSVNTLRNTEYGFLYSQGCYPAAFDQRTSEDRESIGEHFVMTQGGLFAFIGNTRYGWYMPGGTDGASQYYDRKYFEGLFVTGYPELGKALTYSRLQNLNAAMSNDVMAWCYKEVVLFGDPSISVKLPDPDLPLLSLESYSFSDVDGDGDGNINPGELIRFYPVIRNHVDWSYALDVSLHIEGLPAGVTMQNNSLVIDFLENGEANTEGEYLLMQMPDVLGYGTFGFDVVLESTHPITSSSTGKRTFKASFTTTLMDHSFPWSANTSGKSAPVVIDVNNDNELDIVFASIFGDTHIVSKNGIELGNFSPNSQQNINRSFAIGDVDGSGSDDIAFCSRTGNLYAMTSSGDVIFEHQSGSIFLFTPVLADITGNGLNEVIAGAMNGSIYVVNSSGESVAGFPIDLGSPISSELAVADVDGDGYFEIIAGLFNGNIIVIGSDGTIKPAFTRNLGQKVSGSPVVLADGQIAVATDSKLFLINSDGDVVFEKPITSSVAGGLVTADINRDLSPDIVFVTSTGVLNAVDQEGQDFAGFPVSTGENFTCPPLIADISGDGQYDIFLHSFQNSLYAYSHGGIMVPGFPFLTTYSGATPGTLVDLNNNGMFKFVSGYAYGIFVANLRKPSSTKTPWITYRGSNSRQGSFAATGYVANEDVHAVVLSDRLHQNFPNPFNPSTNIEFSIGSEGYVSLEIFNLRGQKVKTLINKALAGGFHSVYWDGKNDTGKNVASGVYLYRLKTASGIMSRKMLLMK